MQGVQHAFLCVWMSSLFCSMTFIVCLMTGTKLEYFDADLRAILHRATAVLWKRLQYHICSPLQHVRWRLVIKTLVMHFCLFWNVKVFWIFFVEFLLIDDINGHSRCLEMRQDLATSHPRAQAVQWPDQLTPEKLLRFLAKSLGLCGRGRQSYRG